MVNFVPFKNEKENISIWLESKTISKLEEVAGEVDISRNELISQCISFALENMKLQKNSNDAVSDANGELSETSLDNPKEDVSC